MMALWDLHARLMDAFDPYYEWLGIPPKDQPPNAYRLLGLELFESNPKVIETAAEQRMLLLRTRQSGKHSHESQRLLNEIIAAHVSRSCQAHLIR